MKYSANSVWENKDEYDVAVVGATSVLAILAYAVAIAWFIWRRKKENNPQDYADKHILVIELWIISIFVIAVMQKVTILIAW